MDDEDLTSRRLRACDLLLPPLSLAVGVVDGMSSALSLLYVLVSEHSRHLDERDRVESEMLRDVEAITRSEP